MDFRVYFNKNDALSAGIKVGDQIVEEYIDHSHCYVEEECLHGFCNAETVERIVGFELILPTGAIICVRRGFNDDDNLTPYFVLSLNTTEEETFDWVKANVEGASVHFT